MFPLFMFLFFLLFGYWTGDRRKVPLRIWLMNSDNKRFRMCSSGSDDNLLQTSLSCACPKSSTQQIDHQQQAFTMLATKQWRSNPAWERQRECFAQLAGTEGDWKPQKNTFLIATSTLRLHRMDMRPAPRFLYIGMRKPHATRSWSG